MLTTSSPGLQHGYDTVVGERGIPLSGGERSASPLRGRFCTTSDLILDEATSSVEPRRARIRRRSSG